MPDNTKNAITRWTLAIKRNSFFPKVDNWTILNNKKIVKKRSAKAWVIVTRHTFSRQKMKKQICQKNIVKQLVYREMNLTLQKRKLTNF
jgi:hypothetical protein